MIILISHFPTLHFNELEIKNGRISLFGIIRPAFFSRFMQGSSPELVGYPRFHMQNISFYLNITIVVYMYTSYMYSYSSYPFLNKVSKASNIKTFSCSS